MAADFQKLMSLFQEATEKYAPEEWDDFVKLAAGNDEELKRQVRQLLHVHAHGASLFDKQVLPGAILDQPPLERPGTQVGAYKLLQEIGQGGMGVVYMAEQHQPVRRMVALKIIKPGMDTRQVIARFEAERQALSLMDHPNIAKVLDGGATDSGRPYFVMELVKGQPITEYCDEHHLTPRQRLELIMPVCQAIQHAHQKGIIHRDIKPSNVLVTEYDQQPVPKIIDFGVAKAVSQRLTEKTVFTGFGQIVGTLEYMSPEQAALNQLDLDTRSDIYSLGVLLYELLTGSTPFDRSVLRSAAWDEMLRIIREDEPPKPSTRLSNSKDSLPSISARRKTEPARLTKLVRGELDWIVMKALDKDRNRRYETASGMADDIRRYLHNEPVQACPPRAGYRLIKFTRRNKGGLIVAAAVILALLAAAAAFGWSVRDRAAREQRIAQEKARAMALTEEAIRQALDRGMAKRGELHAVLKTPGGAQRLLNQRARWELLIQSSRSELTQARQLAIRSEGSLRPEWARSLDTLEKQLASDRADRDLALRLEQIRLDRATCENGGKFDYQKAAREYPDAFADFRVLQDDPAKVAIRIRRSPIGELLVAALDDWAWCAHKIPEPSILEQLLAVSRQAAPDPSWGDRLRQPQVWREPESLVRLASEAPTAGLSPQLLHLTGVLLQAVDATLAETWLRRAQAEHPADFWLSFELGNALMRSNPAEAAGFFRLALAVRPGTAAAHNNLGCTLFQQQKLPEAVAAFRKAIETHSKNAFAYNNLGCSLRDMQQRTEAIAAFQKALEIDPNYDRAYSNSGLALFEHNQRDAAFAACEKAIQLNPGSAWNWSGRGWLHMLSGQLDKAIADQTKAIELQPNDGRFWNDRSVTWLKLGQLEKSLADSVRATDLHPNYAPAWFNRGEAHRRLGRHLVAIMDYRRAIDLHTLTLLDTRLAHRRLASLLSQMGNEDEARNLSAFAVELDRKLVALRPNDAEPWQDLGWDQYGAGDWNGCIESLEKSCRLQAGGIGDAGQFIVMALAHARLAGLDSLPEAQRSQHFAEARRWYEKAVTEIDAWAPSDHPNIQAIFAFREQADELIGAKSGDD